MLQSSSVLMELEWRGLLFQHSEGLESALSSALLKVYAGFDPTAPSLHAGNLVPIMGLVHLQRAGHTPFALVGGGTGLIGDPSGKTAERQLNTPELVRVNAESIRAQLEKFLDFSGPNAARMDDNARWLLDLRAVDFMRDVGKHFRLNYMLAKESVDSRLETGISYTEFSYMLLQAYDYLELFRRHGVTLQIGGSDQWGNITAGIDLIRKAEGAAVHALTLPLVTTAAGTKFGKTEAGSVWLDADRTSPYRFYQFWVNTDDRDTSRFLRYFTLLTRDEISELDRLITDRPERREAQARLASEMTRLVHGAEAAAAAEQISRILFGGGDPATLAEPTLVALRREIPYLEISRERAIPEGGAVDGTVADVVQLLVEGKIATSRGAARRLLEQGGVYVNSQRVRTDTRLLTEASLLPGRHILIRKGAREYLMVRIAEHPGGGEVTGLSPTP